jgi:hypothetical protein
MVTRSFTILVISCSRTANLRLAGRNCRGCDRHLPLNLYLGGGDNRATWRVTLCGDVCEGASNRDHGRWCRSSLVWCSRTGYEFQSATDIGPQLCRLVQSSIPRSHYSVRWLGCGWLPPSPAGSARNLLASALRSPSRGNRWLSHWVEGTAGKLGQRRYRCPTITRYAVW